MGCGCIARAEISIFIATDICIDKAGIFPFWSFVEITRRDKKSEFQAIIPATHGVSNSAARTYDKVKIIHSSVSYMVVCNYIYMRRSIGFNDVNWRVFITLLTLADLGDVLQDIDP